MKRILFTCFASIVLMSANAQQWNYSDYEKIDHTNFRLDERVKQIYDQSNPDIPLMNAIIFFLTNEIRAENNLKVLKYHKSCEIAAYNHSLKMVEQDFFSHFNTKDETRKTTNNRANLAGIDNPYIAENIAYIYPNNSNTYLETAEEFIETWMNSKGHKDNILSEKALQLGCGIYTGEDKAYATQVFQWFAEIESSKARDKLPKLKNGEQP